MKIPRRKWQRHAGVVPSEGGTLFLTVTDANDDQDSDQIWIEVDPEAFDC